MTNYDSGRRKEYAAVHQLRREGYAASRSAGSHGLWDVCAVKSGLPVRLIQVKYTFRPEPVYDANVQELSVLHPAGKVSREVWVYRRGNTTPEIILL